MKSSTRLALATVFLVATPAFADDAPWTPVADRSFNLQVPTDASSAQPGPSATPAPAPAAPSQADDNERLASAHRWKLAGGIVIGVGITAAAASIALAIGNAQCAPDSDCQTATGAYSVLAGLGAVVTLPVGIGFYLHGRSLRSPATVSWLELPHGGGLALRSEF